MKTHYLDERRLDALDADEFQQREPYPWSNAEGLLTDTGFGELLDTLPRVDQFDQVFGKTRKFGQQSHDRYSLEYRPGLALNRPWQDFIDELDGSRYRDFLRRMFGHGSFRLRYHWHYTPTGCSVSPHCDSKHKLGSHIFYLNTAENWERDWGGETLILDDKGRFSSASSPGFSDFDRVMSAEAIGNWSLLFGRKGNSWHGVKEINCPEGELRKVFIVVIERSTLSRLRGRLFGGGAG